MEKTEKLRLLEKLWYSRNPCHDIDAMGNDRFWETVMFVFEDYNNALTRSFVMCRLLCINTNGYRCLTKGKKYTAINETETHWTIKDDFNHSNKLQKELFKKL